MNLGLRISRSETLTRGQRLGDLAEIGGLLLLAGFFWLHQSTHTGFFNDRFGPLEMVALYAPIGIAIVPMAVRAAVGRRNPARLLVAAGHVSLALGSCWLLIVFPFRFAHLADVLPASLHFLLAWVTDGVGSVPLLLQVILMPISALTNVLTYRSMRQREAEGAASREPV